ncbi:hypothetical protein GCM10008119_28660 [Pedobacter mendelii]|uniref:Uncharacterized protein n=1 Tax=Pedobacter mendelii TaxID=1908240 RepID=A0ABQ2BM30_9SPHI|nr:hypothetical protein GCM10008119_28660 [Pedobacter mendelii]
MAEGIESPPTSSTTLPLIFPLSTAKTFKAFSTKKEVIKKISKCFFKGLDFLKKRHFENIQNAFIVLF